MKRFKKIPSKSIGVQIFTLTLWFLITVIEWSQNPKTSPGLMIPVIIRGTEVLSIFLVTSLFIWVLENMNSQQRILRVYIVTLIALYPAAIIANLISLGFRAAIGYTPPPLGTFFFAHSLHFYLPMLLVMVAYTIVRNQLEIARERENRLKAESLAQQARWMMLRYQVNPHFLFNALNSIRALIGNDDDKARSVVTGLSEYFRYSLTSDNETMVSLEHEIHAVRSYLEIQKIRFGQRLDLKMELDPDTLPCAVPVFSIQTLVENGIKYGLKTSDGLLHLIVRSSIEKDCLHISVINTGKLLSANHSIEKGQGSGTGLDNLKERLSYLDPGSRFSLYEENGQVVARLILTVKYIDNEDMEGADRR